jgi:hypothetical protein
MTIKSKKDPGPFAGWPGADGRAGDWAAILAANRHALDRWATVSNTMVKGMFAISQEMALFAETRLKEEAKNCEALIHCHSPSEALSCQHRFAAAAAAEYLQEANRLTVLLTRIANDGFASLQHSGAEKVGATWPKIASAGRGLGHTRLSGQIFVPHRVR